jgi:NTP pyrophosphatase (non-canonical NTP hydrolase)
MTELRDLIEHVRRFSKERDWDQFHSPKNLAMALSVEASEIVEIFQWLTEEESRTLDAKRLSELEAEIGDVLILLSNLADRCGIDPLEAARKKMVVNESKYPADRVRGQAKKYSEYP